MLAVIGFRQRWRNAVEVYRFFHMFPRRKRVDWAAKAFARSARRGALESFRARIEVA